MKIEKETRTCVEPDCGKRFEARFTSIVVRCPDCRLARRTARHAKTKPSPLRTCLCGKTVTIDSLGRPTGWACPRFCHLPVEQRPEVRVA